MTAKKHAAKKPAPANGNRENRALVVYNDDEWALIQSAAAKVSLAPATWIRMITVSTARGGAQ